MKKTLALLLALLLLLAAAPSALAVGNYEQVIAEGLIEAYDSGRPIRLDAAANWDADLDAILYLLCSVLPEHLSLSVEGDTRFVTYEAKILSDERTSELLPRAEVVLSEILTEGMSPREQVTAMHDWLVRQTVYREDGPRSHAPQGVLREGAAVCDGYTRTLLLFCRMTGIPCLFLGSDSMNHSYNAVWIDGEWLLVDATWDDPEQGDTVSDTYLLRPFAEVKDHKADGAGVSLEEILAFGEQYYAYLIEAALAGESGGPALGDVDTAPEGEGQPEAVPMTQEQMADLLKEKGLFLGTDLGYELERSPTRAEAAVLFVRVLGREGEALMAEAVHPFTDVPEWAAPHIALLSREGLTRGQSETLFGSAAVTAARDYATFLLRALGAVDGVDFEWSTAMETATARGFAPAGWDGESFTRGDAVEMTARALGFVPVSTPTVDGAADGTSADDGETGDDTVREGDAEGDEAVDEAVAPEGDVLPEGL